MKPLTHKKLHKEQCYQEMKARIVTGIHPPGSTLNEASLMQEYSIGRTPLREVLLRFQGDGLIIRVPRGGTVVAPLDINNLMHILEVRMPLELYAGELACKRITDAQLTDLTQHLRRLQETARQNRPGYEFARQEMAFHSLVYQATQNPELAHLLEQLHNKSARVWYCLAGAGENISFGIHDLEDMMQALLNKDTGAMKRLAKRHIAGLKSEVEKKINS